TTLFYILHSPSWLILASYLFHELESPYSFYDHSIQRHLPRSTFFPYTTLFRSRYGSSHIGATAKDISNVVTDAASGDDIRNILRSEERFSRNAETDLVCRLLLEKKNALKVDVDRITVAVFLIGVLHD